MIEKNKNLLTYCVAFGVVAFFAIFKLLTLSLHYGDSNAYFYMAKAVLAGNVPYRDFFLADPPALVYILAFLRIFFGNNLLVYQALPIFFESATAILLFFILKKQGIRLAFLAPIIYLFSFTILATSDYLTGGQFVIFFSILGIFFYDNKKPFLSGISFALGFLVKFYALPGFFGFLLFLLLRKDRENLYKILCTFLAIILLVFLPFIILSANNLFNYTFLHHLNRPAGLSKINVFGFLLAKEWLLIGFAVSGIVFLKEKKFFYPMLFSVIFFLIFQDIYYAYFDSFFAYITIFAVLFLDYIFKIKKPLFYILIFIYSVFLLYSLGFYEKTSFIIDRFDNVYEIADYVKTLPQNIKIYGSHEVAPLVALLSNRELFLNYIDTNAQAFGSLALDVNKISESAVNSGIILIARINRLPEYGIFDTGFENFFNKQIFEKYCQNLKYFTKDDKELGGFIGIYKCSKN